MAVSFRVDAFHLLPEKAPVGGGITELVDGDVVMDHLMEDSVFDEFFGQVYFDVDTEHKVLVARRAEEPGFMASEGQFAKKRPRMGQFDRDRG